MALDRQHYKEFFGLTDEEVDAMFEAFRETTSGSVDSKTDGSPNTVTAD